MSATNELYAWGDNMEIVEIDAITSEATGFPKEHIIDNNLDTYWEPTSTANQTIDFDLGEAKTIDAIIFFVNNYDTLATAAVDRHWSDNDFGDTTFISGSPALGSDTTTPLRISIGSLGISHRWWRLIVNNQSEVVNISGIWFCEKFDIGQPNEWPEFDPDRFENIKIALSGGREHLISKNRRSRKIIPRQFMFDGNNNFNELRAGHQASGGNRWPLVYYDGTTYRVVRFRSMDFVASQVGYQRYEPAVVFEELPYIHGGDSY